MREPSSTLRAEIDRVRAEEAAAIREAVRLKKAAAPPEAVNAAFRQCEMARQRKNELVQRLITAVEREKPGR